MLFGQEFQNVGMPNVFSRMTKLSFLLKTDTRKVERKEFFHRRVLCTIFHIQGIAVYLFTVLARL